MKRALSYAASLVLGALCLGCPPADTGKTDGGETPQASESPAEAGGDELRTKAGKIFGALPSEAPAKDGPAREALVSLGRQLYFEKRLSKNQDISCNTCHGLTSFGVDPREGATSKGHKDQVGDRNSPTVYNAALHVSQFWDGRAKTVEEQATMPITNPVEMAMADDAAVVAVLKSIPGYVEAFGEAFPDAGDAAISMPNVGKAIGAFERGLLTPSRFDAWLGGKDDALSDAEKAGLEVYLDKNCQMCHTGKLFGGSMMMKLGLQEAWPNNTDEGAGDFMFKVPSLRNVNKTGTYLHDGSIASLDECNTMMAKYQLRLEGEDFTEADAKAIAAFLASLEGEVPADYIKEPALPESGPDTPAADPN
jgi:cytochrome c peroxidase